MACHFKPSTAGFRSLASAARSSPVKSPRSSSLHTATSPIQRLSRTSPLSVSGPLRNQTPKALAITAVRHASSSAPTSSQPDIPKDVLTWDRFFNIRRKRRYVNLGASVMTGGGALLALGPVLAQQDIDAWAAQVSGLDPMMVLGITGIAIAAGGWLCGPTFGNGLFKVWAARKGWNHSIAEKEKSFFARIKRYRADPASSSIQNPIPDYYGEKIASVKDYRRWLKDQRAFNLKKNKNMI